MFKFSHKPKSIKTKAKVRGKFLNIPLFRSARVCLATVLLANTAVTYASLDTGGTDFTGFVTAYSMDPGTFSSTMYNYQVGISNSILASNNFGGSIT